jgi:hypothetical protein
MILFYLHKQKNRFGLLVITLLFPSLIYSQSKSGSILSTETNSPVGFVNIGIIGKNIGTVSDEQGNFSIKLDKIYDNDSIRFSIIGYESKTFLVSYFKNDSIKTVYLKSVSYELKEVKVVYRRTRDVLIGEEVSSGNLISGFASNDLGAEIGINVNVKHQMKIKDINFNVAVCTFDSVTYRLKIYQLVDKKEYINILPKPIYISFSKYKIHKAITFDLTKYPIIIEGNVLITLELFRDLGKGNLLFFTKDSDGTTIHKKTSEGVWSSSPGIIGMYLHGQLLK